MKKYEGITREINKEGMAKLCQAVLASGIREQDEEFLNSPILNFYIDNGFSKGTFGSRMYRKLFDTYKNKRKDVVNTTSIDVNELKERLKTMPMEEVCEYYGKTKASMYSLCYRKGIVISSL